MSGCNSDEERQVAHERLSSTSAIESCTMAGISTYYPSPIYRLSTDVLRSIFELYCEVKLHAEFPLQWLARVNPQLIICHVCAAWRQTMLDSPLFWNKIRIAFRKHMPNDMMVKALSIWLSRAKDLPCFIDFNFLPFQIVAFDPHPLCPGDINRNIVRDLIAPYKCKSLGVIFAHHHLHDFLQLSDEKLSYIEVLSLRYVHDENNREAVLPLDFHKLSNLTSFSLFPNLCHFASTAPPIAEYQHFQMFSGIPWHQLRHIHLGVELPALRCLSILDMSSLVLETCSLVVLEALSFASSQIKTVHCPQLRKLECRIYPNTTLTDGDSFLLCLRLPKLKSLELFCPKNSDVPIGSRTLFRMQNVCSMYLEELKIEGCNYHVDAGALLASMPSLRSLEVPKNSMFSMDAIRKIGTGSIGPLLEKLTIDTVKPSNEIDELIQMVKMRSSVGKETSTRAKIIPTPFRSVRLYCDDPDGSVREEYDEIINEINQSGIELAVIFLDASLLDGW